MGAPYGLLRYGINKNPCVCVDARSSCCREVVQIASHEDVNLVSSGDPWCNAQYENHMCCMHQIFR